MTTAATTEVDVPRPGKRAQTILVVEDEVLVRATLAQYLTDSGFGVIAAGQASEAVHIQEDGKSRIDLVFGDVMMPGVMDGFGLTQWVRENRPKLPVILTLGVFGNNSIARTALENHSFVAKPYDIARVIARIRHMIEQSERGFRR